MHQALYHPAHGYYSSGRAKLGRHGDFYTSVSVGPMFGRLLAFQFAEVWEHLGRPANFQIVEQGAHEGQLAHDVLAALTTISPECFETVRYHIIEPFPVLREMQANHLTEFGDHISWSWSLEKTEPFAGIYFSNELLDSMPVHLVRRLQNGGDLMWTEKLVNCQDERLGFVEGPLTDQRIAEQLGELAALPVDAEIEINLAALKWITALSKKLERGYAITIDYGYVTADLALRPQAGTLQCRAQHRAIDSPFDFIGECDITAHVNWSATAREAEKQGLVIEGFTDQHHFLTGILARYPAAIPAGNAAGSRQLQTLLHPEMMGRSFQVLALSQGPAAGPGLSGFRFARSPRDQLGL
ncbi:MAG TPA: SAM-dependent methyltransferase [Chthoniobacterales bacterium]|nr:SAM-dependent methyltransferase [Chthoniobacterales bacterium]